MEDKENKPKDNSFNYYEELYNDLSFEMSGHYWRNKYESEKSFWEERLKLTLSEKDTLKNETQALKTLLDNLTLKIKQLEHNYAEDKLAYEQKLELKLKELESAQERSKYEEKIKQLEKRNIILRKGLTPLDQIEESELRSPSSVIALASQKIMLDLALEKEALMKRIEKLEKTIEDQKVEAAKMTEEFKLEAQKLDETIKMRDQIIAKSELDVKEKIHDFNIKSTAEIFKMKLEAEKDIKDNIDLISVFASKVQDMVAEIVMTGKDFILNRRMSGFLRQELLDMVVGWQNLSESVAVFSDTVHLKQSEKKPENIEHILDDSLGGLLNNILSGHIIIEKKYCGNLPDLMLNRDLIMQLFGIIITNSIEAMPSGGRLRAETIFDPNLKEVIVVISDSGFGISKENIARVFKPYFTTKQNHSGLGLYRASKIARLHYCDIFLENTKGTTVKLHFKI